MIAVDDFQPIKGGKDGSSKQDGTLAFLRQCILEFRAGMDILFNPQEEKLKASLWNYLLKIAKKVEI